MHACFLRRVPEGKSEGRGTFIVYHKSDVAALKKMIDELFHICTLLAFHFLSAGDNIVILLYR